MHGVRCTSEGRRLHHVSVFIDSDHLKVNGGYMGVELVDHSPFLFWTVALFNIIVVFVIIEYFLSADCRSVMILVDQLYPPLLRAV